MKKAILIFAVLAIMLAPAVMAADCGEDDLACRIGNVTNLVSMIGGALAVLALSVVGVMMFNAKDPSERDQLKERLKYVVIGLVVIVLAPQVVKYLLNI